MENKENEQPKGKCDGSVVIAFLILLVFGWLIPGELLVYIILGSALVWYINRNKNKSVENKDESKKEE